MSPPDVVVIGAGIIGAACALACTDRGQRVLVLDRGGIASGTTGAGEGNILVSDKPPGPELELALLSMRLWRELDERLDRDIELEAKGGVVVTTGAPGFAALQSRAESQRGAGVDCHEVAGDTLRSLEPHLVDGLAGGVHYPQDMQVQPMLAAAVLLRAARGAGAEVRTGVTVTGITRGRDGRVTGLETDRGSFAAGAVVNAAGTGSRAVAALAGSVVPVEPRRGFILVTVPVPRLVHHKVYDADYVSDVASGEGHLQSSAVVEGTRAGTVLIGASRERVGLDPGFAILVLRRLARQAVDLFPVLADVELLRAYRGYRPFTPDHLPVIGPDPAVPGLLHACGHEGAGVGLAPATGAIVADVLVGAPPTLDVTAFAPGRFAAPVPA